MVGPTDGPRVGDRRHGGAEGKALHVKQVGQTQRGAVKTVGPITLGCQSLAVSHCSLLKSCAHANRVQPYLSCSGSLGRIQMQSTSPAPDGFSTHFWLSIQASASVTFDIGSSEASIMS